MKPRSKCYSGRVRRTLRGILSFVVITAFVVVGACDGDQAACKVDTDCPQGTICRESQCGPVGGDASVPLDAAPAPVCAVESAPCNVPEDCCTRICTSGRCASSTPPPIPSCRGSLELCQNDCCVGFTCTAGVCR